MWMQVFAVAGEAWIRSLQVATDTWSATSRGTTGELPTTSMLGSRENVGTILIRGDRFAQINLLMRKRKSEGEASFG